jgi:NAD-dependent dihydropyrimidine dehydrogenase PreA subunit
MSPFDCDPFDDAKPSMPELEKIETDDQDRTNQFTGAGIKIDFDLCEATGVCAEVCPEDVLEHINGNTKVIAAQKCTECWICIENCVSGAIEIG